MPLTPVPQPIASLRRIKPTTSRWFGAAIGTKLKGIVLLCAGVFAVGYAGWTVATGQSVKVSRPITTLVIAGGEAALYNILLAGLGVAGVVCGVRFLLEKDGGWGE